MDDFNALGHTLIGVSLSALVIDYTDWGSVGIMLVVFGSLLPDIDHPNSTLGRYNPLTRVKVRKTKKGSRAPVMKHRGKAHTIVGALLLSAPFLLVGPLAFALVAYGAIGHLLADKVYSWFPKKRKFVIKLW